MASQGWSRVCGLVGLSPSHMYSLFFKHSNHLGVMSTSVRAMQKTFFSTQIKFSVHDFNLSAVIDIKHAHAKESDDMVVRLSCADRHYFCRGSALRTPQPNFGKIQCSDNSFQELKS